MPPYIYKFLPFFIAISNDNIRKSFKDALTFLKITFIIE